MMRIYTRSGEHMLFQNTRVLCVCLCGGERGQQPSRRQRRHRGLQRHQHDNDIAPMLCYEPYYSICMLRSHMFAFCRSEERGGCRGRQRGRMRARLINSTLSVSMRVAMSCFFQQWVNSRYIQQFACVFCVRVTATCLFGSSVTDEKLPLLFRGYFGNMYQQCFA